MGRASRATRRAGAQPPAYPHHCPAASCSQREVVQNGFGLPGNPPVRLPKQVRRGGGHFLLAGGDRCWPCLLLCRAATGAAAAAAARHLTRLLRCCR